ncbi:hypothetical protein WN944_012955 [Citrus x changshan-huyou]|uniref:Uncharacterized protein n=1 Tax=Citrus x changshan-huyou TaxID=2935761 RepID=A0AAP0M4P8_9ROSI
MTKAMKAEYVGAESRGFSPRPLLGTGRKIDFSVSGDFEPIPIQVVMRLRFCASDSDQKRLKAGKKREKEPVAVASSDEHYGPSIMRIK